MLSMFYITGKFNTCYTWSEINGFAIISYVIVGFSGGRFNGSNNFVCSLNYWLRCFWLIGLLVVDNFEWSMGFYWITLVI